MLFLPWRNEEQELVAIDPTEKARVNMDTIMENSKPFYSNREIDDTVLGCYITSIETEDDEGLDEEVVQNDMEIIENDQLVESFLTGSRSKSGGIEKFLAPKLIEEEEYLAKMQQLNSKQRKIVMHVLHCLKTDKTPFHIFLTGGAGVGKSHVISSIVQSYLRFCNKFKDIGTEEVCVIVSAPTGKAAFNVFGMTLHCAFKIPPTQHGGDIGKLSESVANTLRIKYKNVKLFIIDEISMVSGRQFSQIDSRLRQLFNSNLPFGGKSLLVVGHLRQLPPVSGGTRHFIFKTPPSSGKANIILRNPDWELFAFYELEEIMRQRDEAEFCKALNNMAEGEMDAQDIKLIKSREIGNDLSPPTEAIWLFPYNKDCREHNAKVYSKLSTNEASSVAFDKVVGKFT